MDNTNNTIWVLTEIENGVVGRISTNAPEHIDVRSQVVDHDQMYEDAECMERTQEYIGALCEDGKLRCVDNIPFWGLMEAETSTFRNRYPDDHSGYEFVQVCELPSGGFGIAYTDGRVINLGNFDDSELHVLLGRAGWDIDDTRLAYGLDNEDVALCVFRENMAKYIIPDLRFDTFWEARAYMAMKYLDCFVAPQIDYSMRVSSQDNYPICIDLEDTLPGFDKETLVCVALALEQRVNVYSMHSPSVRTFRLETMLARSSALSIKDKFAKRKSSAMYQELIKLNKHSIINLLIRYNNQLKDQYRNDGNIQGVQDLNSFLTLLKRVSEGPYKL